ncbi:MAG: SU10 major capsid protein [Aestuariivirga sp.]
MAQPTNTFDRYDMVGIREDLSDEIYNVAPTETPIQNALQKAKATQQNHEWQTDTLAAAAVPTPVIAGDVTTADAMAATVRLGNRCQIIKGSVLVEDADPELKKAGRGRDMAYLKMKRLKELRRNMDMLLTANQAKVVGSSAAGAALAGIPAWFTTNVSMGAGGANGAGDGTTARTDGTQRAFTETLLKTVLRTTWDNGGNPDKVFMTSQNQDIASAFVGRANAIDQMEKGKVDFSVTAYATPYGNVSFVPTRFMRTRDVLGLDTDHWAVAWLRPWQSKRLASQGDYEQEQILCEFTLEARNQASSFIIADLT